MTKIELLEIFADNDVVTFCKPLMRLTIKATQSRNFFALNHDNIVRFYNAEKICLKIKQLQNEGWELFNPTP